MVSYEYVDTCIGILRICADEQALFEITRLRGETPEAANPNEITRCAAVQLTEYFCSKRRAFDLPLSPRGTAFQRTVWRELQAVPFGRTVSYRELGNAGKPSASRAVGGAVGANPLLIVVPCHRVIRTDGALGGFSAGLDAKVKLLELEGIQEFQA